MRTRHRQIRAEDGCFRRVYLRMERVGIRALWKPELSQRGKSNREQVADHG